MYDGFNGAASLGMAALFADSDISGYFMSLPEQVRRRLREHASEIHTEEELHRMAEQLLGEM